MLISVSLIYYIAWLTFCLWLVMSGIQGELTYGKIGEWRFDKRSYDNIVPPRNLPLPPPGVPESVVHVLCPNSCRISMVNLVHKTKYDRVVLDELKKFQTQSKILVMTERTYSIITFAGDTCENG